MPFTPTLYTPQLTLRPFVLADALRVQELAGDPRIAATTAHIPHPYPSGLAEDWIRSHGALAQDGKQFNFAITLTGTRTPGRENDIFDTGHLIGTVSLILSDEPEPANEPEPGGAELGYWIGTPYWNRGFATEAAHAALAFGFLCKGLQRIIARHGAHNPASGCVLQKLGMTHQDTLHKKFVKGDDSYDLECYAITKIEWLRTRARHRFPAAHRALHPVAV